MGCQQKTSVFCIFLTCVTLGAFLENRCFYWKVGEESADWLVRHAASPRNHPVAKRNYHLLGTSWKGKPLSMATNKLVRSSSIFFSKRKVQIQQKTIQKERNAVLGLSNWHLIEDILIENNYSSDAPETSIAGLTNIFFDLLQRNIHLHSSAYPGKTPPKSGQTCTMIISRKPLPSINVVPLLGGSSHLESG